MKEAIRQKQFQRALDLHAQVSSKVSELEELEGRKESADEEVQRLQAALASSDDDKNGLLPMAQWRRCKETPYKSTNRKPRTAAPSGNQRLGTQKRCAWV